MRFEAHGYKYSAYSRLEGGAYSTRLQSEEDLIRWLENNANDGRVLVIDQFTTEGV